MPIRAALVALAALALGAPAAQAAQVGVDEIPVKIAASLSDDEGNPVVLDGGVDVPKEGCPCPGVIINHGFLGSWRDSGNMARELASYGYVVLRYSSRGFGETPGEVDLMGPKERQDLLDAVHWLNDPKSPVVGGKVIKNDIGQFGGSYGGAHAWWLATSGDPAVRTVVPTATWTDIYQALMPNDVELLAYVNGFYATGLDAGADLTNGKFPPRTTDNYSQEMHRWIAEANSGANVKDLRAGLSSRSVTGRYGDVNIPVFLIQGTNDGLFSANQAIDAYQALAKRDVPVRLYVGGVGHPPSESSLDSPEAKHVEVEVLAWFDHYLKGRDNGIEDLPPIEYSHADYFNNTWDGKTQSANAYPFGPARGLNLCTSSPRGGALSSEPCPGAPPAVAANSAGQGLNQEPVTAGFMEDDPTGLAATDLSQAPPTLSYDSEPLTKDWDMIGVPKMRLEAASLDAIPADLRGGAAAFQLDPKLYDVAPDGTAKLLTRGAFAEPLDTRAPGPDVQPQHAVDFDLYGLSNVIKAGHRLRLTLSTSDAPYLRPTPNPFAVALMAGSSVSLPTAGDMVPTPSFG